MTDIQQKIEYIQQNGVIFDKWLKKPNEYKYMIEHTYNILKLFIKHNFSINNTKYNLNVNMKTINNYLGEYIAFGINIIGDDNVYYEHQIYNDKVETVYCPDGFGVYYTEKKYYNKQFINMILQKNTQNKI